MYCKYYKLWYKYKNVHKSFTQIKFFRSSNLHFSLCLSIEIECSLWQVFPSVRKIVSTTSTTFILQIGKINACCAWQKESAWK